MKNSRGKSTPKSPSRASRFFSVRYLWIVLLVVAAAGVFVAAPWKKPPPTASNPPVAATIGNEDRVFAEYAGSANCRDCHAAVSDAWARSNHGLAERAPNDALDGTAFEPARSFHHGTQSTEVRTRDGRFEVTAIGLGGKAAPFVVDRVIGHDPIRQFLVAAPGGRWQTLEASFDPHKGEWFNVYGNEDRQPGEWGHWTGRGMNWNSMCATCHNTRARKNYDAKTDTFRTTMAERTVSCESCHGPMKAHAEWRRKFPATTEPDPTIKKLTRDQGFDTCGGCHARRGELTGDFHPGEKFSDHHSLTVVDETDTYFADGQVSGENYEYGSFLGSKMHGAGVRCSDCHDPHTAKPIASGNALCIRCHNGSPQPSITKPAPIIDPVAHSHHVAESAGSQCISCHMPVTIYMQRHPRHDHGFTIPDPLLTKQHGIPNACNKCHADKDAAWSLAAVEQWYGEKMNRPTRQRAQAIAEARRGSASSRDPLLQIAADNSSPYWQASAAHLLSQWITEAPVNAMLIKQTLHPSPIVRGAAAHGLEPLLASRPDAREMVGKLLDDPDRSVRSAAAWALRDTLALDSLAGRELQHQMAHNADQPLGRMQLAAFALARNDVSTAVKELRRAVEWDPNSAPIRHEYAVALSMAGQGAAALEQIQAAVRLEPKQAEFRFKLALAWNETGRTDQTVAELQQAVALDPTHARAWYNLGLAQNALGRTDQALVSLLRGEAVAPQDARLPYARATILARLGQTAEAKSAAQRALSIQPGYPEATQLLRSLGP